MAGSKKLPHNQIYLESVTGESFMDQIHNASVPADLIPSMRALLDAFLPKALQDDAKGAFQLIAANIARPQVVS